MTDTNRKEKLREHFKNHGTKYIAGGAVATGIVCGLVGYKAGVGRAAKEFAQNVTTPTAIAVGKGASATNNIVQVVTKGHPGNVIEDLTSGITYFSQADAAKALCVSANEIRNAVRNNGSVLVDGATHILKNHGPNTGFRVV